MHQGGTVPIFEGRTNNMTTTTVKALKPGALFYTVKEYDKHGDNEKYLRCKMDYDRSTRKWYCPRWCFDAIGTGRSFKGDEKVIII